MDKRQKLEILLDIYASESIKFEELPPIKDEKTKKDVEVQYEKLMKAREKIIDLFFN